MSQYNHRKPLATRLLEQEQGLARVTRELEQLRARAPQAVLHRDIRWAITTGSIPSTYPQEDSNTFPIRFLDAHFTKTAGLQTFDDTARSTDAVTLAHAGTGQYIPPALPLPVFWQRGLGGADKGEWWFLDPPRLYVVELDQDLEAGDSVPATIWLPDATFTLQNSGIDITVYDVLLSAGQTIAAGTRLIAEWYLAPFSMWIVGRERCTRLAWATLTYDLCGGTTATYDNFEFLLGGTLAAPPTTAYNPFAHRGMVGDWVLLAETTLHASGWVVIDIEKHAHKVFTDLRQTGDCLHWCIEGKAVTAALEVCAVPAWETIYCNPCATYPQTSVFVETSMGSTSVPAFGCCVDTLNLDLGITTYDDAGEVIPTTAATPLFASIFSDGACVPGGFGLYNPREWDINHPEDHVNYNPDQTGDVSMTSYVNGGPYDGDPAWGIVSESWHIECSRRINPMTGALLFPSDPTQREWRLVGTVGHQAIGSGSAPVVTLMIFESGVAIYILPDGYRALTQGGLTVHSCNPFHATATFVSLGDNWTDPEGGTGRNMSYPTEGCTTSTFEITE